MNWKMILEHIIAIGAMGFTLVNICSVEIFNGLQSIIMIVTIVYCVYVYMVYWDITKNQQGWAVLTSVNNYDIVVKYTLVAYGMGICKKYNKKRLTNITAFDKLRAGQTRANT